MKTNRPKLVEMMDYIDEYLDKPAIGLHPLRFRHAVLCWQLAHDPAVRAVSYSRSPPTLWRHLRWMWRWAGPNAEYRGWVIKENTWPHGDLGIVRIGPDRYLPGHDQEVHVALFKWARGVRYGRQALDRVRAQHVAQHSYSLNAYIKQDNERAQRAFTAAGYRRVGTARDGFVRHVAQKNHQPEEET